MKTIFESLSWFEAGLLSVLPWIVADMLGQLFGRTIQSPPPWGFWSRRLICGPSVIDLAVLTGFVILGPISLFTGIGCVCFGAFMVLFSGSIELARWTTTNFNLHGPLWNLCKRSERSDRG